MAQLDKDRTDPPSEAAADDVWQPVVQGRGVRELFVGADHSLAERTRLRRWRDILAKFPDFAQMRVLDLGGTSIFWRRAPVRPKSVVVINLGDPGQSLSWLRPVVGDAIEAPSLTQGETFDLVMSNSLIEHLGGHLQRKRFAEVVRAMAPRYMVQTPYRYFPIEPHWVFPGMQFLPAAARMWLAPRWPLGHTRNWAPEKAREEALFTELLGKAEMRSYFPDATIKVERFLGLPKSLMAFR